MTLDVLHGVGNASGGNGEQQKVDAAELVLLAAKGAHPQVAREVHARQIALVLARAGQLLGLRRRAAQKRRANTGTLEQHGNRGAERPGPYDGGAAWMLTGVADGRRT